MSEPLFPPSVRAGELLFVSGQASVDDAGTIVPGTFAEEMDRSIENVRRVLAASGLALSDVVKVNAFVHDPADLPEYNRLYPTYFAAPRPARTTIAGCLTEAIKFELDVVAYLGRRG
jgi:2-iminobutanoate/2-iminopropanoate deaminase